MYSLSRGQGLLPLPRPLLFAIRLGESGIDRRESVDIQMNLMVTIYLPFSLSIQAILISNPIPSGTPLQLGHYQMLEAHRT